MRCFTAAAWLVARSPVSVLRAKALGHLVNHAKKLLQELLQDVFGV